MDTGGFYTYDTETSEGFYAPNFVYAKDFQLLKEQKDIYTYPEHNWYWFNSLKQAQTFFNTDYNFGLEDPPAHV
jgi:hypothetical protein